MSLLCLRYQKAALPNVGLLLAGFSFEHRISDLCCFHSEAASVTRSLLTHESPDVFFLLLLFVPHLWFLALFCLFISLIFGVSGCVSYQDFKLSFISFMHFFSISPGLSPNSNTTVTLESCASVSLAVHLTFLSCHLPCSQLPFSSSLFYGLGSTVESFQWMYYFSLWSFSRQNFKSLDRVWLLCWG